MELTVLGCSGSYGAPGGGACSGYLLAVGRHLDLGRLRQRHVRPPAGARRGRGPHRGRAHPRPPRPLRRHLRPARAAALRPRPRGPAGVRARGPREASCCRSCQRLGQRLRLARGRRRRHRRRSATSSCGSRAPTTRRPRTRSRRRADGRRMIYTADTGPELERRRVRPRRRPRAVGGDVPPRQPSRRRSTCRRSRRATAAREAGAQRLILTHLWPMIDRAEAATEGSEAFGESRHPGAAGLVTTI